MNTIESAQTNLDAARAARAEHVALIQSTARDYHGAKAKADSYLQLLGNGEVTSLEAGAIKSAPQALAELHQALTAELSSFDAEVLNAEVDVIRAQVIDSASDLLSFEDRERIVSDLADAIEPALAVAKAKLDAHNRVIAGAESALRNHRSRDLNGVRLEINASVPYLTVDGETYTTANDTGLADALATELNKRRLQSAWDNR
ncbi:hypothetical protein [Kocuria oceani]|uniref:Uncharacterized protein n=1 Tax=Kocuria oceani TaxID=988827 RepID=A0ABV9TEX3_9MICC|nr:hypothetical protein [Kocuria oceani]